MENGRKNRKNEKGKFGQNQPDGGWILKAMTEKRVRKKGMFNREKSEICEMKQRREASTDEAGPRKLSGQIGASS